MEQAAIRPGRAGWQSTETDRLFSAVKEANAAGKPLRSVFEALAGDLGRKPNSIRNYYYACLRQQPGAQREAAFQPFTPEETHELLRQVLLARGRGKSVRSCVMQLSGGSHSKMLRYQNKYRTILRTRPELIAQVCEELRREGLPCPEEQSTPAADMADTAFCDPEDAAAARLMAQPCVHDMLEGLKELLRRAARSEASPADAKASDLQRQLDRMQVQHDLQRLVWERDYADCEALLRRLMGTVHTLLASGGTEERRASAQAEAYAALHSAEALLARSQALVQ